MTTTPCRSCRAPKPARMYLCRSCWDQLPAPTRRALNQRDRHAYGRLRDLHQQLDGGRALREIEVTP